VETAEDAEAAEETEGDGAAEKDGDDATVAADAAEEGSASK